MSKQVAPQALVVDDNPSWLDTLTRLAIGVGYTVATARTYAEAMHKLEGLISPDLVITDIRLQDDKESNEDGLLLLRKLSQRGQLRASIVVTGYPSLQTREAAEKLGAAYFVKGRFTGEDFRRESEKGRSSVSATPEQCPQLQKSCMPLTARRYSRSPFRGIWGQTDWSLP